MTECDCDTIGSQASGDKHLLERYGLKSLPVKRKFLRLRGKIVVPVIESLRCFFLKITRESFEAFELDQTLDGVPSDFREPVFERHWASNIGSQRAVDEELHLSVVVFAIELTLLHETEGKEREENLLMTFEETTSNPLVDGHANLLYEIKYTCVIIIVLISSSNSVEEEQTERLKRVLVHVGNNAKFDAQEVKHSTFSRYSSVDFTRDGNSLLSHFSNDLLFLNSGGSLLSSLKTINKSKVLKNCGWVSIRKVL